MSDLIVAILRAELVGMPWAILPEKLPALIEMLDRPSAVPLASMDEMPHLSRVEAGTTTREVRGVLVRQVGRVAVVPMFGTISQRPGLFTRYSGGASAEQFAAVNEELAADPAVSAIVWDVDSPGGSAYGLPEAADRLYALRGQKRTVAVSNALMASAAYFLASAADEVVAAPSSMTGSIGVYMLHEDHSGANDQAGVKVTYVYAGKRKIDGNFDAPLGDTARASIQQKVDDYYAQFITAVARHRGATQAAVRGGFGEGDVLTAERAVAARLADRVETLDSVVRRLGGKMTSRPDVSRAAARQRLAVARSRDD